jgi:hypothetical protein
MIFSTFLFFFDFVRFFSSRSDSNFLAVKDFWKEFIPEDELGESMLNYLFSFFFLCDFLSLVFSALMFYSIVINRL